MLVSTRYGEVLEVFLRLSKHESNYQKTLISKFNTKQFFPQNSGSSFPLNIKQREKPQKKKLVNQNTLEINFQKRIDKLKRKSTIAPQLEKIKTKGPETLNSLKRISYMHGIEKQTPLQLNLGGHNLKQSRLKVPNSRQELVKPRSSLSSDKIQISVNNQMTSEMNLGIYSQSEIGSSESIQDFWQSQISKEFHKNSEPQLQIEISEELDLYLTYGSGLEIYFWRLSGDETKFDWKNNFMFKMFVKKPPKLVRFLGNLSLFGVLDCNSSKIDFYSVKFVSEDARGPRRVAGVDIQRSFIVPENEYFFVHAFSFHRTSQPSVTKLFLHLTLTKLSAKYEEKMLFAYDFHAKTVLSPRKVTHSKENDPASGQAGDGGTICFQIPQNTNDFLDIDILRREDLKVPISKLFELRDQLEVETEVGFYLDQLQATRNGKYFCGVVKMTLPESTHYTLQIWNEADLNSKAPGERTKALNLRSLDTLSEFADFRFAHSHQGWLRHSPHNSSSLDSHLLLSNCLEVRDALVFGDVHGFLFVTRKNSFHPFENPHVDKLAVLRQKQLSEKDLKCFSVSKFRRLNALTSVASEGNRECLEFTGGYSARVIPLVSGKVTWLDIARRSKKLFVVSDSENCLIQLSIVENKVNWDSDFKLLRHISSLTSLSLNFAKLEKKLLQAGLRKELQQMKSAPCEQTLCEAAHEKDDNFFLILKRVFGRKAFKGRNNLLAGKKNKIIFNSCSLVCALDISVYRHPRRSPKRGESLKMGFYGIESLFDSSPSNRRVLTQGGPLSEISALALTPDKCILIAGTLSPASRLLFWDLNTKLLLYTLELTDCCLIQTIRVSRSGGKLVVLGLTLQRFQKIYYVDCKVHPPVVLTSFPFTFSNSKR